MVSVFYQKNKSWGFLKSQTRHFKKKDLAKAQGRKDLRAERLV